MRAVPLAILLVSCGADPQPSAPPPPVPSACGELQVRTAEGCLTVGVTSCAAGFVADDAGGCRAVLPAEPCGPGTFAIPGDIACHQPSECVDPVGATLFVSASASSSGDGSAARPFRTIGAAVNAAPRGAIIAVGPGTYREAVIIRRPLTLAGRCAAEVKVTTDSFAAIRIESDAVVRGLSVTGQNIGISAHDAADVVIEQTRIHGTGNYGVYTSSSGAPASMVIRDSLIEGATATGLNVASADVVLERSVVRDTRARAADGQTGYGVVAKHYSSMSTGLVARPARLTIRRSVIEENDTINVLTAAAQSAIEDSVVRNARPRPLDGEVGACVQAQDSSDVADVGAMTITSSVLSGCNESGLIVVGTRADLAGTTIRDVRSRRSDGVMGMGVSAQIETKSKRPATVNLRDSLITDVRYAGLLSVASVVSIERTLVRNTLAEEASGLFGDGIAVAAWSDSTTDFDAPLTLVASVVSASARSGVAVFGTRALLRDVRLACNPVDLDAERAYNGYVVDDGYAEREFLIEDGGGNVCGCDATAACRAQSTSLRPVDRLTK